ncbi:Oxo-4-hydroxy-4-carboxy-5-ureidoimidazoline decarboxylase, partial [Trichophaea hybrida]
ISTLTSSSPTEIQSVLDTLFEPSPTLYTLVSSHLPPSFTSYNEFADFVADLLFTLDDDEKLLNILGAHPRLGAKNVESVHSRGEQRSLGGGEEEEGERLERLNVEYERVFPGIVFVAGRSRQVIMQNMEKRIARADIEAEKKEAIEAMRDIAKDRASK